MSNTRSGTAILAEVRDGQLVIELSEQIKAAVAAVHEHNKAARVMVELTISPWKGTEKLIEPPVIIVGEVSSKLPKPESPATLFFIGEDQNLTRNAGTRQSDLGLSIATVAK